MKLFFLAVLLLAAGGLVLVPAVRAERLAVKVRKANVRSGPGTDHEIIWQVGLYYPLQIVEKKGHWYNFTDFEGDAGWISEKLVGKIKTVITRKNKCNVRSGPGTENRVVFIADRGVAMKVLGSRGKWLQVRHPDGEQGWIHRSLVW
ncbi:MAG: SH3 domain-containing protein [Deltaproteobacteria bacterium]|nr:SH3 domain-containing protein [Deltaproteobacteria bacterium]